MPLNAIQVSVSERLPFNAIKDHLKNLLDLKKTTPPFWECCYLKKPLKNRYLLLNSEQTTAVAMATLSDSEPLRSAGYGGM